MRLGCAPQSREGCLGERVATYRNLLSLHLLHARIFLTSATFLRFRRSKSLRLFLVPFGAFGLAGKQMIKPSSALAVGGLIEACSVSDRAGRLGTDWRRDA